MRGGSVNDRIDNIYLGLSFVGVLQLVRGRKDERMYRQGVGDAGPRCPGVRIGRC